MITSRPMETVVSENFERYAGNVILDRAICDVRDMLKPGVRMLMYSQMHISKNTYKKPHIKSARIVGDCLGHLYEHGDASCYGAYMRMAKPFAMRYPLEQCQGNYGTIAGEEEAAMRYTELRLNELSSYIYGGLNENAIDASAWRSNFDETEQYPGVMPSIGYFNICNGTTGLGIAISSSIPQFNLKEVNEAIVKLIKNPETPDKEIVLMPDFATGATLTNSAEVYDALRTGSGKSCRLRAKIDFNPSLNALVVTEVPYGVSTGAIKKAIEEKIESDDDYGVESVNDNTGGDTPELYITLSKGVNPNKMIAKLYHDTPLESHFTINMWVLKDGRYPTLMGLREIFMNYIAHIRACKRREIEFEKNKAEARLNVVDGLLLALANIDDIVAIIKGSDNPSEAAKALTAKYKFNKEQVDAILGMKLSSLCRLDGVKLNEERAELITFIADCNYLLTEPTALDEKLIEVLELVANKFGDARRTKIENILGDEEEPEEILEKDVAVVYYGDKIQLVEKKDGATVYKLPKGITKHQMIYTTNLGALTLITDAGKMYNASLSKIKLSKEYKLNEVFEIGGEHPRLLIDTASFMAYDTITCVTKSGLIKKSKTSEYLARSKKGTAAIKLEEGDSVVAVLMSSDDEDRIVIISNTGYYNCYPLSEISATGRITKGVKAIKLADKEYVKEVKWVGDDSYKDTARAVKGVKNG